MVADFVDGANVRVIERGGGAGLALEAPEGLGVMGQLWGKNLQCYEAAEFGVLSLVDHTHPAATQRLNDAVMGDGLGDHCMSLDVIGCPRLLLPVVRRAEDLIKRYNDILKSGQSLEKFPPRMY